MRDTQFGHAPLDSAGLPTADHGDFNSGIYQLANAETVLCIEHLGFDSVVRQIESAVREYSINVECNQSNYRQ
jgi:hypothetical protein